MRICVSGRKSHRRQQNCSEIRNKENSVSGGEQRKGKIKKQGGL
jgi:hypothetical protein